MSEPALADAARQALLEVEDARDLRDVLITRQTEAIAELIPLPARKKFKTLRITQQAEFLELNKRVEKIEKRAKALCLELGTTVTGETLQISYKPGQDEANIDRLKGMIPAYPPIAEAITVGNPTTRIGKRGKADIESDS